MKLSRYMLWGISDLTE